MLALRDENALAPKTPGARYPKTPLKVPLNDENAVGGAKTALAPKSSGNIQGTAKKQNLVTPSEIRARAPLGNKTTNAKARSTQNAGGKDLEKTQTKPTTTKKLKQRSPSIGPLKLEVRNDQSGPAEEPDVEYAPPPSKELPYESDVFPDGVLTFEGLKPENMFKGYYNHFYNPMGEDGVRLQDRKQKEKLKKALKESDERILRDIREMDWSVSDVPETAVRAAGGAPKHPPTITSRRAASALSMSTGSTIRQKKTVEQKPTVRRPLSALLPRTRPTKTVAASKSTAAQSAVGEAASRNTLGYTKGRSASSVVSGRAPASAAARSASADIATVVPPNIVARRDASPQKQKREVRDANEDLGRLQFLSIFDPAGDDEDDGIGSAGPRNEDFEEDEFEMKLSF
ncbi:hypothetical protein Ct61P_02891 [Colletotrichum tofieldiae]|nr:hypothetical protein Ct61P_02891 [Colletotrichum tofieldiae]